MKQTITLTFEELDIISDALQILKRQYPVSWSKDDEETLEKIRKAWENAYKERR